VNVSVVIPALDEEKLLASAIASVRGGASEILVVDGGSRDGTRALAIAYGARVIDSPAKRGTQLDRGAREAKGDLLLFLHADTRLEAGWHEALERLAPEVVGGAFHFALHTQRPGRRYAEWAVTLRGRLLRLPFGDQAIFCRRDSYHTSGGFPHEPLFEDVAFFVRLRRLGPTAFVPVRAVSSARRWERDGPIFTTVRNNFLLLLYLAGVPPSRLWEMYGPGPR
jgi:rSAM/selenodomain-associated transferase 2